MGANLWSLRPTDANDTLLKQRCIRWLGHVTRMKGGRIPKDFLYGELATRPTGRPQLRFNDVCKRDLQALGINTDFGKLLPQTEMAGDTQ